MGTWIGAFVEVGDRDPLAEALAGHGITLERPPGGDWLYLQAEPSLASLVPPDIARALSRQLGGRVIAFLLQSTASVEELVCFEAGEEVRRLSYSADEGGWLAQDGAPQGWERVYFFEDDHGTGADEEWPLELNDEIEEEDIARYEAARAEGDGAAVLDLLHVGSGWGLYRLAAHLGLDPAAPHAIYRPPANRRLRWKVYALGAAALAFFALMFLLGRA